MSQAIIVLITNIVFKQANGTEGNEIRNKKNQANESTNQSISPCSGTHMSILCEGV